MRKYDGAARPIYVLYKTVVSITLLCQVRIFNLLQSNTNQELFEKYLCNQSKQ